ncbi:MAG: FHA domain-containing protein [Verrucomicrobiota bacterium]|jgi:pSer/pThr/pTyr-binding forkhead associated (FHA) protein
MAESKTTNAGNIRVLRRGRETHRHSLEQLEGEGAPREITIEAGGLVMGRAADTQLRLASKRVSPLHAFFRVRGTDCILRDNDSRNGVYLNGVKVYSAVLREGDLIQVAESLFVYHED